MPHDFLPPLPGLLDPEHRLVLQVREDRSIGFVSPALASAVGRDAAQLVGRALAEALPQPLFAELAGLADSLTPEAPLGVEVAAFERAGGGTVRAHWTTFTWFDAASRPRGFIAVGRDLAEAEQVLEALDLKRHVLANLPSGVTLVRGSDGVLVYTNPAFDRLLGYEPGELVGRHVSVLNAASGQSPEERARAIFSELERDGHWAGDIPNRSKDGATIWCDVRVVGVDHPLWGRMWLSDHIDISAQRRMADELVESETRLQAIVDNTTAVVYVKAPDGRYQLVNRRFEEIFNVRNEDVRGRTDHELFPAEIAGPIRLNDLAVARARTALEFDEIVPQDDGDHSYISVKFPLFRSSGEVYAVCGISTDITYRLRAQHALEESHALLERRVAERTAELSTINRRLEAEVAERRRGEARQALMTTELDHRVKNALTTVVALADQTLDTSTSLEEFRVSFLGRLGTMAKSHEALARGRWEGVDVREAVKLVLAPFESISRGGIRIEGGPIRLAAKAALPVCLTLHELGTNSVKYGCLTQPSGELQVSWRILAPERLELTWRERGGPATFAPSRFGMGLQLVRELIEGQLNGTASLSFAGEGFGCALEIPITAQPLLSTVPAPEAPAPEASRISLAGAHVLIVEDDRLQANMLGRWFGRLGCAIVGPAKSTDEAMRLVRDQRIDVAVLDVNLDGHSSEPVADALLARGKTVVFLSGNAEATRLSPRFAEVTCLAKPIELYDLEQAIRRALGARAP